MNNIWVLVANFGMLAAMWATVYVTRRRHREEDETSDRAALNQHLLECAKSNGALEEWMKSINARMTKVERKLDNVAAQMHNLANEANDTITTRFRRVGENYDE